MSNIRLSRVNSKITMSKIKIVLFSHMFILLSILHQSILPPEILNYAKSLPLPTNKTLLWLKSLIEASSNCKFFQKKAHTFILRISSMSVPTSLTRMIWAFKNLSVQLLMQLMTCTHFHQRVRISWHSQHTMTTLRLSNYLSRIVSSK